MGSETLRDDVTKLRTSANEARHQLAVLEQGHLPANWSRVVQSILVLIMRLGPGFKIRDIDTRKAVIEISIQRPVMHVLVHQLRDELRGESENEGVDQY